MMKVFFFNALFLLSFSIAYCQKCVVANVRENIVYLGVSNPLDIAVNGYLCKNFEVSTDNGKVEKGNEICSYSYLPKTTGIANIIIKDKKSKKLLGRMPFRVEDIPPPTAMVAGKNGGEIR